uniref:Biogenesis of lysosome-related organelles complex 1 subunit 2 n=1 Tax=Acrobeloides nanus TaxID=290746 RepID=A0A914D856_9BILA
MAEINERASTSVEPTLSPTSTISDEAHRLSDNVFDKISAFVNGQIQGTIDDYKLLEEMNNVTAQRYADMKQVAATVSDRLSQLNEKYETLRPYLQQIDEIDSNSRKMEEAVALLENYVTALETKLKKFQQNQPS